MVFSKKLREILHHRPNSYMLLRLALCGQLGWLWKNTPISSKHTLSLLPSWHGNHISTVTGLSSILPRSRLWHLTLWNVCVSVAPALTCRDDEGYQGLSTVLPFREQTILLMRPLEILTIIVNDGSAQSLLLTVLPHDLGRRGYQECVPIPFHAIIWNLIFILLHGFKEHGFKMAVHQQDINLHKMILV